MAARACRERRVAEEKSASPPTIRSAPAIGKTSRVDVPVRGLDFSGLCCTGVAPEVLALGHGVPVEVGDGVDPFIEACASFHLYSRPVCGWMPVAK